MHIFDLSAYTVQNRPNGVQNPADDQKEEGSRIDTFNQWAHQPSPRYQIIETTRNRFILTALRTIPNMDTAQTKPNKNHPEAPPILSKETGV